jgi:hypothetical protein
MLAEIFGDYPQVRVLELLLGNPGVEYTKTDIASLAKISRATLYTFWDNLERQKIVKVARKIANSELYTLNTDSELVQNLRRLLGPFIAPPKKREKDEMKELENQKKEIEEFLRSLDEYFGEGTLSESAYKELREKNQRKLEEIERKLREFE